MEPYRDSIEHLHDEFARFDFLLKRALVLARPASPQTAADEFRGLVVTEGEVDELLRTTNLLGERWERADALRPQLQRLDEEIDQRRKEIDERIAASRDGNIVLSLPALAAQFRLSQAEVDLLLIALAPELEPRYETLYAYLQNDVTRKHPSVNLALNLICRSEREKLKAREFFAPTAPLLAHRILELGDESQDRQPSLLRKFFKPDENIVRVLLEQTPGTAAGASLVPIAALPEEIELDPGTRTGLENLAARLKADPALKPVIRLISDSPNTLREAAELLSAEIGKSIILSELRDLGDESRLATLMRDAVLWNAILALEESELRPTGDNATSPGPRTQTLLWRRLRDRPQLVLLLGPASSFGTVPAELTLWQLEVKAPDFKVRRRAWQMALADRADEVDSARLADTFHFGGRRIRQTVKAAVGVAALRDPLQAEPTTEDLLNAGRALTAPRGGGFSVRVEPRYGWDDIVLPPDAMRQLQRVAAWMQHRRQVHEEWGFGEKLSRGKGLNVLFSGPSGTGKTMAAEILARTLSLDLLQIDLSSVVSKYIGETEKNLSTIFREAEQSQSLLFFDEADSLFGKRTEVKDAHDRYANIEVNYLLQRIEQYEGVVILATNFQNNIDEAFLRRIHEMVEFPFPDQSFRERIWRAHFPENAPRAADIDYAFLARQFKLTGGAIKNVVLNAAFRAAQRPERQAIEMADLILATVSELRKEGKLCTRSDFGPYYDLIQKEGGLS